MAAKKESKNTPAVPTEGATKVVGQAAPVRPVEKPITLEDITEPDLKGSSVVVVILTGEHNGLRRTFSKEMHGEDWKKAAEAFRVRHNGEFVKEKEKAE